MPTADRNTNRIPKKKMNGELQNQETVKIKEEKDINDK